MFDEKNGNQIARDLAFLRFLTRDAKIPLAVAMSKVKPMQAEGMISPSSIASAKPAKIQEIFQDQAEPEKLAKQIYNAAKRISKKSDSPAGSKSITSPQTGRRKTSPGSTHDSAEDDFAKLERELALPDPCMNEAAISNTVLVTNRAPLVLAFAVVLLKYTMPSQPLSSRLSLAQAYVSINSRSKAVSIGLEHGPSAEEEGWGAGQPVVRIMGRDVRVLKRIDYNRAPAQNSDSIETSQDTQDQEPALWGLDLEAMKRKDSPSVDKTSRSLSSLPIYTPQGARSYLMRSFQVKQESSSKDTKSSATSAQRAVELLLGSIELLYGSWIDTLGPVELDRRAWSWYVNVRPDVANGVAGWGGKGEVPLDKILRLRRVTKE